MNANAISIQELCQRLFPIHRSQTGEGVRSTFAAIKEFGIPLEVHEVPSGEAVFDWTVPREWRITDAYIKDSEGNRIVDYSESNLHILNGSVPVDQTMQFAELAPFLHTQADRPEAIPYRTAFFEKKWGFCVTRDQYEQLKFHDGPLEVRIESEFFDGSLSYAEATLNGTSDSTVVIWTHTCHPSLGNDNVSGMVASAELYKRLAGTERRFNYRFVFAPATIGAIVWLSKNERRLDEVDFGLVICLLGSEGSFTFKRTRSENHLIDRCLELLARDTDQPVSLINFSPIGYDERQFSSPGINIPFARITRSEPGQYPEYHTSDDSCGFISEFRILESVDMIYSVLKMAEGNCLPINTSPNCEPCLGSRGLFARYGDKRADSLSQHSILWTLNLADGHNDALAISERSSIPFSEILNAIRILNDNGLIDIRSA